MDENRPMTKREIKALRHMERTAKEKEGHDSGGTMKWIIIAAGSVLFLAFFAFTVILIKQSKNKPIEITSSGWMKGSETATTTLVEFGDFQCPACKAVEPMVRQALREFDGKVKLRFKHFPLTSIHPNAMLGSRAAEAAGVQNKFFEMHDWLYDNQESWASLTGPEARDKMIEAAEILKLDVEKFTKDLESQEVEEKVTAMQSEGIEIGVAATPTFYINNKKVESNPTSYEELKKIIEESLK